MKYHCAEQAAGTEASALMKYKETGQEEGHSSRAPVSETFSPEQVLLLLKRCQRDARSIYLPLLLAVTAVLTVPEIYRNRDGFFRFFYSIKNVLALL